MAATLMVGQSLSHYKILDRLGDGGYVEASGALTLEQIIQALANEKLIRADGTPGVCGSSASSAPSTASGTPTGDCYVLWEQVRILILDNAPTYVALATMAAGQEQFHGLQHDAPAVLQVISCGAVFFGALTYIGNGPNFMVKAIAEENGVKMPSFFGYMAWSRGRRLIAFSPGDPR